MNSAGEEARGAHSAGGKLLGAGGLQGGVPGRQGSCTHISSLATLMPRLKQDDGGRGQVWVALFPVQSGPSRGSLKILVTRWGCWASVLVRKDSLLNTATRAWGHGARGFRAG